VLDVKAQRRQALRNTLLSLAQEIARTREAILLRRTRLRTLLEDLAGQPLADRIANQAVFMQFVGVEESAIGRLEARRADLEARRAEARTRFLQARTECKMLTRLREKAFDAYVREVAAAEQKAIDESAQLAYARKASAGAA